MEINLENKIEKRRLSIITDVVIFLILLNVFVFGFRFISTRYTVTNNLSLEDVEIGNKNYIESNYIQENYGIKIVYGDGSYESALKVDANVQEDEYTIYDNLVSIKNTLKKYPDSFFMNNNLTIVILDKFNNQNIALASRNKLNEFKIYISNNENFERALHHEMYHVFEYKLNITNSHLFDNWNDFNPVNFTYTDNTMALDDKYIYDKYTSEDQAYFVTKYSKTSGKEDRAEIFAEVMTFNNKPEYLYDGTNICKKAKQLVNIMSVSLKDTGDVSFYWNRF